VLLSQAQLTYQISPIILTGGIASNIAGGMLPLLSITNGNAFSNDLLNGATDFELDDAFGIFSPAVGGSLVQQTIAQYPFANLSVAANAIIRDPIIVSMIMMTPMKSNMAWEQKLAIMTALKQTLDNHNNAGGTYTVMTPAYTYTNLLMEDLVDISMANSPLPQNAWRWDFKAPLVTLAQAAAAMSNLMNQITNGTQTGTTTGGGAGDGDGTTTSTTGDGTTPATTNPDTAIGQPPSIANTGLGGGSTSPWVSIMGPSVTSPDAAIGPAASSWTLPGYGGSTTPPPTPDPLGWSVGVNPQ
jgi:hypothetical protein